MSVTLAVCFIGVLYLLNILPKSTTSLQAHNIESGVFEEIYTKISHIANIKETDNVTLQSRNLRFVFNSNKKILKFRSEVQINDIAYELYTDGEKVYSKQISKKDSIIQLNLSYLLKSFDRIDYTFLLDNLKKGDQYTFALYPQNSVNKAGYVYDIEEYGDVKIFVYKDNIIKKISDDKYESSADTLLFSLSSMKQSYENHSSKGYQPLDKVFIIIEF